jgi:hypothetical protein
VKTDASRAVTYALIEAENQAATLRAVLRALVAAQTGRAAICRVVLRNISGVADVTSGAEVSIMPAHSAELLLRRQPAVWGEVSRVSHDGQVSVDGGVTWKELDL